ncbi:MAG: hypothetical protein ACRELY_04890 [Polyangiaceae bacterium]
MWVVPEEKATDEQPPGMGIRFLFANKDESDAVDHFVEVMMEEALGHHISQKLLAKK